MRVPALFIAIACSLLMLQGALPGMLALAAEPVAGTGLSSPEEGRRNLSMAWKYFNDGKYEMAENSFRIAARHPELNLDARFGLGLSHMKMKKATAAIEEFTFLIDKGYKTGEVLAPLMWLLIETGQYGRATDYLKLAEDGVQKAQWKSLIREGVFKRKAQLATEKGDADALLNAVRDNSGLLASCAAPYVFFNSAKTLSKAGRPDDAKAIHLEILGSCPDDTELRGLVFGQLALLQDARETRELLGQERNAHASEIGYLLKLDAIEASLLAASLEMARPDSDEAYEVIKRMSELSPDDEGVLVRLSWANLNMKEYRQAYEGFSRLAGEHPENTDYALGLSYALLNLGRYDEALRLAESFEGKAGEFRGIRVSALSGIARKAYNERDYETALEYYGMLLEIDPGNDEALSLTAWSHFNSGRSAEALPYFLRRYGETGDPDFIMPILSIYEDTDTEKARSFRDELAGSGDAGKLHALADFYASKGRRITAAETADEAPEACYYNADRPWIEASFLARDKSGDAGRSRLKETDLSAAVHYPIRGGQEVSVSVTHISLDSESAPDGVFAGSYYTGSPQPGGMNDSASLIEPGLRYQKEGKVSYSLALGGSPGGGEARMRPTFSAGARARQWSIELHRDPVRESILSYSGLRDPYGPSWWGGVLRTGVKGSLSTNPALRYVFRFEAGYDRYEGENVIDNNAYNATVSISRLLQKRKADIIIGGAVSTMRFENDTNHFTFGHGGYFSPQSFISAGPSIRITSRPCKPFRFDMGASASYMSQSTDDSMHYPLDKAVPQGVYEGESVSGISLSLSAEARKLLASSWSAGASLNYASSPDYDEWRAGLWLRYLAGGRSAVSP